MVWEESKQAQTWSGTSPKKLRAVWEKPKRFRLGLKEAKTRRSPARLRNGLAQTWSGRSPNSSDMVQGAGVAIVFVGGRVHRQLYCLGGPGCTGNCLEGGTGNCLGGGRQLSWGWPGCTGNCLGFRVSTFDTQKLDRLDGQCTFSALRKHSRSSDSFGLSSVGSKPSAGL